MKQPGKIANKSNEDDFCPRCGLMVVSDSTQGSLTSFLFFHTRCKCVADKAFANGQMSTTFKKLKQSTAGSTFNSADDNVARPDARHIDLANGATIGGAYQIIELIGCGGMGEVYLALHSSLNKKCALKVIPPEKVTEMGWLRFQQEAKAVAQLDHLNLVRVTDLGIHEGCLPFYAMDYVKGETLADILAQSYNLPITTVLEIFMQVCDGVEYAHRHGILHRDLKPANIMIEQIPNHKLVAKVLDFGLAKLTKHDRFKQSLTAVGDIFGSPFYMSPEQCNGGTLDRRSDIYSIGCTMFECLTGQPPFAGHLASAVMFSHQEADPPALEDVSGRGNFPTALEVVMAKLLRKNPAERYQNLMELHGDLEKVARGENVEPYYSNRGRSSYSDYLDNVQDDENISENASGFFNSKSIILLSLISLAALSSAAFYFYQTKNTSPTKPSSATSTMNFQKSPLDKNAVESQNQKSAADNDDRTPFSSIITGADGKKCKLFKFPPNETLGTIEIGIDSFLERTSGNIRACRGNVTVPLTGNIRFIPHAEFFKHLDYIDRMRPDDFDGLGLEDLGEPGEPVPTDEIVARFLPLTGLKQIKLYGCHLVDSKALPSLAKFPNLHSFVCFDTPITTAAIADWSGLPRLDTLKTPTEYGATALLQKLKDSTKMKVLFVGQCRLTKLDYDLLVSMKNLKALEVPFSSTTNEDLVKLSNLKHLEYLNVSNGEINAGAVPTIQKMVKQGLKRIDLNSSKLSNKDYAYIKQNCGNVMMK